MFGGEDVAEPECDTCLMRAALAAVLSLPEGMTWHRAYNTTSSVPNIGDATVIQFAEHSVLPTGLKSSVGVTPSHAYIAEVAWCYYNVTPAGAVAHGVLL
eukprot:1194974-Prorocentrum_minimum.AAC.2